MSVTATTIPAKRVDEALELYSMMLRIRRFEERAAQLFEAGEMPASSTCPSDRNRWRLASSRPSGLKVVCPATSDDVVGLIKTAIREDDPVVVQFHKALLQQRAEVEDDPQPIPLGAARIRRAGADLTIVTWSGAVGLAGRGRDVGAGGHRGGGHRSALDPAA